MAVSKRRVVDVIADVSGIVILLIVVLFLDQRFRHLLPGASGASSAVDLNGVTESLNTVSTVVAVTAAQFFRSQVAEQMYLAVFAATALLLVVLLMRL